MLNLATFLQNEANCHSINCLHSLKNSFTFRLSSKFSSLEQFLSLNNDLKSLQPHKTIHFQIIYLKLNVIMPNLSRSVQDEANFHNTSCLHPLKCSLFLNYRSWFLVKCKVFVPKSYF